jgi:hypothetical protein
MGADHTTRLATTRWNASDRETERRARVKLCVYLRYRVLCTVL